jgi:RNA polymerase sigma factor (sigma-70 family)
LWSVDLYRFISIMALRTRTIPTKLRISAVKRRLPEKKKESKIRRATAWKIIEESRAPAQRVAGALMRRWGAKLPAEDITSAVDIALCEAIQRFKPSKKTTFLTFAFLYIKGHLVRLIKRSMVEYQHTEFSYSYGDTGDMPSDYSYLQDVAVNSHALGDAQVSTEAQAIESEAQTLGKELFSELPERERSILFRIFILEEQISRDAKDMGYSRHHLFRIKRQATQQLQQLYHKRAA